MLEITSYLRKYPVHFFNKLAEALPQDKIQNSFFIIDRIVFNLYQNNFSAIPQNKVILVDAFEENKSYEKTTEILLELVERNIKKNQTMIVIGGGITQDIGCFIAHIYRRGLNWELYPTTFLAQSDSCIGSKSSINIGAYKNQLGTFYPPNSVVVVFEFLQTLRKEDINSGLGEVLKLAVIDGEATFNKTMSLLKSEEHDARVFSELIQQSLLIKKKFIEEDEFDNGIRNILNLGHTFAHAFETASAFAIPHGIAVLIGVQAACYFSEKLKNIPEASYAGLAACSKKYVGQYHKIFKALDLAKIVSAFRSDKKNTGDKIKFILPHKSLYGNYQVTPLDLNTEIIALLEDFMQTY